MKAMLRYFKGYGDGICTSRNINLRNSTAGLIYRAFDLTFVTPAAVIVILAKVHWHNNSYLMIAVL